MKPNLDFREIFSDAVGTIIAHFTVVIARAVIYSEVIKLKNVLKKFLKYYFIFHLISTANSQFSFNWVSFQNGLGNTSSVAPYQEILNEELYIKTLRGDPRSTTFVIDDSVLVDTTNKSQVFHKSKSIRSRQLFQRSLSTLPDFSIEKSPRDRSTLLTVILPRSPTNFGQFIAKVVDISPVVNLSERDINRTFLASPSDFKTISIHSLHPGHQYSVTVIGRRKGESQLIKEERVITDPVAPDFASPNASVLSFHTNITLRALKPEKALQDSYQISYVQLDPLRHFPKLEVNDIPEQRYIEIYLGNLMPGQNYNVSITPQIKDVEGRPWNGILTTKNLTVTELNTSCLRLSWFLTSRTGADSISIGYRLDKTNSPLTEVRSDLGNFTSKFCETLEISHYSKNSETSDDVKLLYTVKPKAPENLKILTDYEKRKFRLVMDIAPESESYVEKCFVSLVNEKLDVVEKLSSVDSSNSTSAARECSIYVDLYPGQRYEVSAKTISENASSNIISKSFALQPAFDMETFGLQLSESDGTLMLKWPVAEMAQARLDDVWENIVGPDSTLHLRVDPLSKSMWQEQSKRFERRQYERDPLTIPKLRRGACYRVQIYTVTKSGIASAQKFEEFLRISAPKVNITAKEIAKSTASFRAILESPVIFDPPECNLHIVVLDMRNITIYDRTTPLTPEISPVVLEGLQPYHRYIISSQVICGKVNDMSCLPKLRAMEPIFFETRQDRPGPVRSLMVRILNPYSVQLFWLPPSLPNGIITHYIIGIHSMEDDREDDWSVSVGAAVNSPPLSFHDNNTKTNNKQQPIEAVVDNLVGGLRYRMDVRAVTEAGEGDYSAVSDTVHVEMPILPPPRPSSRIEIVYNTIHSTDMGIRYSTSMFNTKHGYLKKSALIVAEVSNNSENIINSIIDGQNKTLTWGQAQQFDLWPAYVAVETTIEPLRKFIPPHFVSEIIGADGTCGDIEVDTICNGPLKPATSYRFKLRLYTSPDMWTDSEYSEIATTKASPTLFTLGSVTTVLPRIYGSQQHPYTYSQQFLGSVGEREDREVTRIGIGILRPNFAYSTSATNQHKQEQNITGDGEVFSHWAVLKMIMAERAAQCLAKLGLNTATTTATSTNILHSQISQPQNIITTTDSTTIVSAKPNDLVTTSGHHRRSRSLRERTGVDQRLERLPSGPVTLQKFTPHTVIPESNIDKSRPVLVNNFAEHVRLMSADSDFRFSEEYEDLKLVGHGQTCIAADLTVNRAKNRFTNILPYDHSRVKLTPTDDDDGSDYGFNSRREFIAAQGPLPSTRDHFWRVVWEQHCPAIIALTKCVEKGRDKCHQYWPDNDQLSVLYADIEVTLMNETVYKEFTVRELKLTNISEPVAPSRTVKHLHYMAWPDFGVPEYAAGLVRFVRLFRTRLPPSPSNKPTVVHCSAGVGRSGTFIALDRLMQCAAKNLPLDVFGIVYEMRLDRCHMVQNEVTFFYFCFPFLPFRQHRRQQYIFIHHCLLYVLETQYDMATNLIGNSLSQVGSNQGTTTSAFLSDNVVIDFPNSITSNDVGNNLNAGITENDVQIICSNGSTTFIGTALQHQPNTTWITTPRVEVHLNPAFDDDEGIAESGL
uniref:protein-tyrosine-phosphatase n=1 Tax=Wuchereria bancrofti TaxID=6293 RepID=A0A1I8EDX7_WUCBA